MKFLRDLSLKVRIVGSAFVVVAIMASVAVIGLDTVGTMKRTFDDYSSDAKLNSMAAFWRGQITHFELLGRTYLSTESEADLRRAYSNAAEAKGYLANSPVGRVSQADRKIIAEVVGAFDAYVEEF